MIELETISAGNQGVFPQFVSFGEALTDLIRGDDERWSALPGGAPWNLARAAASFGLTSAFGGAVSRDVFGDALWRESEKAGLDMRFMQRQTKAPLLAVVHDTRPPRYFFIGDDSADLYFDESLLPPGWEERVQWVAFGGISLARAPLSARLLRLAEGVAIRGGQLFFDPNYRTPMTEDYDGTFARMVALSRLIKVSDEDLQGLFRESDPTLGLRRLRALNPAAVVIHTRGGAGASLYAGAQVWHAAAPRVKVLDTVGAGDCAAAGLLSSLMTSPQAGWEEHLRVAVAAGTGACLTRGATPPTGELCLRLRGEIRINADAL